MFNTYGREIDSFISCLSVILVDADDHTAESASNALRHVAGRLTASADAIVADIGFRRRGMSLPIPVMPRVHLSLPHDVASGRSYFVPRGQQTRLDADHKADRLQVRGLGDDVQIHRTGRCDVSLDGGVLASLSSGSS
jgi:hypothetical protein